MRKYCNIINPAILSLSDKCKRSATNDFQFFLPKALIRTGPYFEIRLTLLIITTVYGSMINSLMYCDTWHTVIDAFFNHPLVTG